jgi:ADP-heptose:LPS heptosyltransferase
LAIDASDENNFSLNNSFLVYLSGALLRLGYKKPRSDIFLNLEVSPCSERKHASEMHLDLLRHLVGDFQPDGIRAEVDPGEKALVKAYLKEKGVGADDLLVGMHIGGRGGKRWPAENFQKLAGWITDSFGAKVIFVWGPEERKTIEKIDARSKDQIVSELFDLPVLSALINRCNLFISPDTGAMHLSVAVGTPTLALFLDSDPVKFGPRGKVHRTLEARSGGISVDMVKTTFEEMVKSRTVIRT